MLYAICENGGMVNENVRWERFECLTEARSAAFDLACAEQAYEDEDNWGFDVHGDPLTKFDVVRVLADGSITTEI